MTTLLAITGGIYAIRATIAFARSTQPPHDLGNQRADVDWHVATVRIGGVRHES